MYANVVTARQRMSGIDRFDLPGFALPPACLTSRPLAGKVLCKIFLVRSEGAEEFSNFNILARWAKIEVHFPRISAFHSFDFEA
jgi:hypothetical protein